MTSTRLFLLFVLFDLSLCQLTEASAIVGAWQYGDGASNRSGVVVFLPNGIYFHAEDVTENTHEFDGMERGNYTWSEATGAFSATPIVDTNGGVGLNDPFHSVVVTGDQLKLTDGEGTETIDRVVHEPGSVVGAWYYGNGAPDDSGVVVFLPNGIYFQAEDTGMGENEFDGMERGTYQWNEVSGAFTANPIVDTNGTLGLNDPFQSVVVQGDELTFTEDEGSETIRRVDGNFVSSAGILPDWRLIKTRNYSQTADDTPPGSPSGWNIYCLVETMHAEDAGAMEIRGGGIVGSLALEQDGTSWSFDRDYDSEALLDAEFPSDTTYTILVSGGTLGSLTQQVPLGAKAYPNPPFLTGTVFTDLNTFDPATEFTLLWNHPGPLTEASGSTGIDVYTEENDLYTWRMSGANTSTVLPAQLLDAGGPHFLFLEFSNTTVLSGDGGFGVWGTSDHNTAADYILGAGAPEDRVLSYAVDAGLTGDDALPLASPFNDGVDNLLKYAFNMDASGPDSRTLQPGQGKSGLPYLSLTDPDSEPVLQIEYIRRKNSGLVYTPMRSTSLAPDSFTPITGAVTVIPIDRDFERVVVSAPSDPTVLDRGFVKVAVTIP